MRLLGEREIAAEDKEAESRVLSGTVRGEAPPGEVERGGGAIKCFGLSILTGLHRIERVLDVREWLKEEVTS